MSIPAPSALDRFGYALYNCGLGLVGLAVLPALPWLRRSATAGLDQRFGNVPPEIESLSGRSPIWVHAASVGEVLAAQPLVSLLREAEPGRSLMMTTTSLTGRRTAREQLDVPAMLLPVDLPWVVRPVLRRVRPAALVILETEIWPNLLRRAAADGIPVLMVSARLSERAAAGYAWVRPLFRAALRQVTAIAAQTDADAQRLIELGAPADRTEVLGSLKFARQVPAATAARAPISFGDRPVLVAASTHEGEEAFVLDACEIVWQSQPNAVLLIAPRRPERFDSVAELLAQRRVAFVRRSLCDAEMPGEARVLLLDSLGELASFFGGARAVFVGGTLVPRGGHNVLEPAVFGVPVAFGPHLDNVREAAAVLLIAGAAREVAGVEELANLWRFVLDSPGEAAEMGERGKRELEKRAAVGQRVLSLVQRCLRRESPTR